VLEDLHWYVTVPIFRPWGRGHSGGRASTSILRAPVTFETDSFPYTHVTTPNLTILRGDDSSVQRTERTGSRARPSTDDSARRWQLQARAVFTREASALTEVATRIDSGFERAMKILLSTEGHVVVVGLGKSGLVGQKIASTFASTGTPAFFVHAAEAFHGDLGAFTDDDTALLISYSGETEEVVELVGHLKRRGIRTIAIVGETTSSLARAVDVALDVGVSREVCPLNLAPTSSIVATLAMGDALAVVMMQERRFRTEDFARLHPGGTLGRRFARTVRDTLPDIGAPMIPLGTTVGQALLAIGSGRSGVAVLVDDRGAPAAIIDSDDLAPVVASGSSNALVELAFSYARTNPATVEETALVARGERLLLEAAVSKLVVVDADGRAVGVFERSHR